MLILWLRNTNITPSLWYYFTREGYGICYTGSTRAACTQLSQHFNTTLSSTYQYNNKNTEEVK